jgi:uncharacterized membrane protein HdeD (DUF308 family)
MSTRPIDPSTYDVDPGRPWIIFAGALLALAGVLNIIYGIAGIGNSKVFVRDAEYVLGNLKTWGWILLIAGIIQLVVAFGVWAATEWGRWLGVIAAALNMFVQFFALPAFPGRALTLFFVDVIVIYGLLTYGGRDRYSLGTLN